MKQPTVTTADRDEVDRMRYDEQGRPRSSAIVFESMALHVAASREAHDLLATVTGVVDAITDLAVEHGFGDQGQELSLTAFVRAAFERSGRRSDEMRDAWNTARRHKDEAEALRAELDSLRESIRQNAELAKLRPNFTDLQALVDAATRVVTFDCSHMGDPRDPMPMCHVCADEQLDREEQLGTALVPFLEFGGGNRD